MKIDRAANEPEQDERQVCSQLVSSDSWTEIGHEGTEEVVFWCRHTRSAIGPDGRIVDEEVCLCSRDCFNR